MALKKGAEMAGSKLLAAFEIAEVPSGFPVGFCLLTHAKRQYVAYYDARRRMTVAARGLDSDRWQYHVLPSEVFWDSHNYVTLAVDDDNYLHLSGNMHGVPLVYFRTSRPGEITTFERIPAMTGRDEKRCTYPQFMRGSDQRLIFHYRDGGSGGGNEIYNVYDLPTRTWKRLMDQPLTDGGGSMNAYLSGPLPGPDGRFHLCWVWRDTPDCRTNHDPSYARSRDLIHWETIDGRPIELPITIDTAGTLIEPIPINAGIINGALRIGFDSRHRVLASYHKHDASGNTQAIVARFEHGCWVSRQISEWEHRWDFNGGGSIEFGIRLGALQAYGQGKLALPYAHFRHGEGLLVIDEQTLVPLGTAEAPRRIPAGLEIPESDFPGMTVQWAEDLGAAPDPGSRYVLRWETLPHHRDAPREGALPAASHLKLYRISAGDV